MALTRDDDLVISIDPFGTLIVDEDGAPLVESYLLKGNPGSRLDGRGYSAVELPGFPDVYVCWDHSRTARNGVASKWLDRDVRGVAVVVRIDEDGPYGLSHSDAVSLSTRWITTAD